MFGAYSSRVRPRQYTIHGANTSTAYTVWPRCCTVYTAYTGAVLCIQHTLVLYCVYSIHWCCTVYTAYTGAVLCIQHTLVLYCVYSIHWCCTMYKVYAVLSYYNKHNA